MVDFRIPLPDDPSELAARELDWDDDLGVWTLSEREYGSPRWSMGLPVTARSLREVLAFFRIRCPVSEDVLAHMSPGSCVLAHRSHADTKDLAASLCRKCGKHWHVYRFEEDEHWHLYGRTCDFSWLRSRLVDPQDGDLLASLLGQPAQSSRPDRR